MWAYMYHRDVIANLRVASNIHFFEDFLFNFYALAKASQISLMHGDFYKYLVNDESTNRQKVNDRRLTCLSVYEMIKSQIADKALKRRMQFFRMHCLLSVILAVAKDVHSDRSYYHTINLNARKMAAEVQFSPFVPLNYKMIHLAALTSPGLLIGFLRKFKYHDT
jgi:hypothetical protein